MNNPLPNRNHTTVTKTILLFLSLIVYSTSIFAQEKPDTSKWINKNKIAKKFMGLITRDPVDDPPAFNVKSEDAYLPFAGKIIRKIIIRRIH